MPRPALRPSSRAAATVDAVALLAFVVIGVSQHHGAFVPGVLRTATPLLAAWFVVGLVVGVYRRVGWITLVVTWIVAVPLGLLARSVLSGGPWGSGLLEFAAVAMAFTLLFLIGGRLLLIAAALGARRGSSRARERAG